MAVSVCMGKGKFSYLFEYISVKFYTVSLCHVGEIYGSFKMTRELWVDFVVFLCASDKVAN